MADDPHLFVYGTLRPDATGPLGTHERKRLAAEADHLGRASVGGHLILLGPAGEYPGLIEGDGNVVGHLYRLRTPAQTLTRLDAYEGVTGSPDDDYVRVVRDVQPLAKGSAPLAAWIYLLTGPRIERGARIASGDWLDAPRAL